MTSTEARGSPIVVFFDGTEYWLADGFHRIAAAKTAALAEVEVEVRRGTLRDAKWFSFGVNAEHGYARGKEDVARILKAIFEDAEWRAIPLREIARHTRIAYRTVNDHYHRLNEHYQKLSGRSAQIAKPATRTVTRGGTSYEMDTGVASASGSPISWPRSMQPKADGAGVVAASGAPASSTQRGP